MDHLSDIYCINIAVCDKVLKLKLCLTEASFLNKNLVFGTQSGKIITSLPQTLPFFPRQNEENVETEMIEREKE